MTNFDPSRVRRDFPILQTRMNNYPLVYLDNGATTQKPQAVIDAIVHYYMHENANIHRGIYSLSQRATESFELARQKVANFIGAPDPACCIFVRGTTEAINLVAQSWGKFNLQPGDEVLLTELEHHSNIVPWQMACQATGASLRTIPMTDEGELDLSNLNELLNSNTKMVSIQQVSNALGTIHDLSTIISRAREVGAKVLVDGAQWVGHFPTDVIALDCDFYTFSGHKLFGPTGIGVLWGRRELLETLPPYQGGGDMIETVSFDRTTYAQLPNRLEAGTPDIAGAIGLGAAIDYVNSLDFAQIVDYEHELLAYATEQMSHIDRLRIVGTASKKAGVISFVCEDVATLDIGIGLDRLGIAVRTGHHCCMPLMHRLKVTGTTRASFAFYNTREDVDALISGLKKILGERLTQTPMIAETSIKFAPASAPTPDAAAAQLADEFLAFDDRESKTELLIDMARQLPNNFAQLKPICKAVPGCMSEVYLLGRPMPSAPHKFEFVADSNAEIVRGLIAVLETLLSGQDAKLLLEFDLESFFRRIGLDQFISSQRRSGLDGMIRNIRTLAMAIVQRQEV
ncbi:MAG: SufS family cysteine desulfurase [Pirellulaceae bacterium]|nr:SufS family cysteine desulfurase [Pirellulaceae bacterium]